MNLLTSFKAFHMNAYSNLVFTMTQNLWFLLITIGVITLTVLSLKKEMDNTVREQQNVL